MEKNNTQRLCGMLGFAMRAGKVIIGTDQVIAAMRAGGGRRPRLVLVSATASDATRKRIGFKCQYYTTPLAGLPFDGVTLGQRLGKTTAPAVIAVTDDRFAEEILAAEGIETIAVKGSFPEGETGDADGSEDK